MNTEHRERCPQVGSVPAKYQLEFSAYLQSRRSGWMSAEEWMARRVAGTGQAVRITSPGTSRSDGTRPLTKQEEGVAGASAQVGAPVQVIDLGHRPLSVNTHWRTGEKTLKDEIKHPSTGEPVTKAATSRADY